MLRFSERHPSQRCLLPCRKDEVLILTRRQNETLMIGDDITVTVLGVKGAQVRLGVNAPKDVAVHREEIFERINAERRESDAAG